MRIAIALALATLLAGCASSPSGTKSEACPVCGKPVEDGPEVRVLLPGQEGPGKRYRCFMCPIMEGAPGAEWTMRAVSGVDGKWVTFRVKSGHAESDPPSAVVLALEVTPGAECLDVHRVFVDEGEFRRYVAAHPAVKDAKPTTFEAVLKANQK